MQDGCWLAEGVRLDEHAGPDGLDHLTVIGPGEDVQKVAIWLPVRPDERFFGLGEKFNAVDQRGRLVDLWVRNGATGDDAYKPVPFWMSTRGYGVALLTDRRAWVQLAHPLEPSWVVATVEGPRLEAVLFHGETLKDLLGAYTAWVGRPPCPPPWVFGPWKSRDWRVENASTVDIDLKRQEELGLCCTVKLIDAGWSTEPNNFTWNPDKYPDPRGLIDRARARGYQVAVWVCPWFIEGTDVFQMLAGQGFLLKAPDHRPYVHRIANAPCLMGAMLDFTHPQARAWWQAGIRGLMELGIRAIKTDFGEQVPVDAVGDDGRSGLQLHNAYPRLYNEATWEVVSDGEGVLLTRSGWAGSQRFPAVWAGDQTADFSPTSGLPSAIVAAQTAGLSGFPFWASDIGGYFGAPSPECFARWTEFGAVSPIMQVHGMGEHDPWNMGAEVLDIYRHYAGLRCRLFPYIYSLARDASATGLPVLRAMALEFPHDADVAGHDFVSFQFMLGSHLLVAPICWDSMRRRRVYLPADNSWVDYWTGELLAGGTVVDASAPLERIPLYLRQGGIIPMQVRPLPLGEGAREVVCFPRGENRFAVYDGSVCAVRERNGHGQLAVIGRMRHPGDRFRIPARGGGWRTIVLPPAASAVDVDL